jgi:cobalamin biosynthesis Mg chelatase CobN
MACGSRKVSKTQVDIKQSVVETTKDTLSQVSIINESLVDTSITVIRCFEPIDSTKEMVIDGHKYKNVRFKTSFSKNGISSTKTENSVLNQSKIAEKSNTIQIESTEKKVDRQPSYFWLWVLLVVIVLGWLWYEFKYR